MWDKKSRFTALVKAYSNDLFRYGYWLCRDRFVAEELVQETFTRAWKSLDSLRDDKAAKAWLLTTLRRENARRFERKQPQIADNVDLDMLPESRSDMDTSSEAFVLRQALADLADEYREPLVLQVIDGYSCEEIADLLNISRSAVMTRLFRARQKLRAVLDPELEAEAG